MTIINENTVVVTSTSELKEALEKDNAYTYIYFGNNITLESGITISKNKNNIIIDGTYNNITYEFTDQKKLGTGDTINISSPTITNVTVKNLKITGYNYYGVIYVPDSSSYKNTTIEYNNITYQGPQISFNPYGLTRFINANITIEDSYATGNEVAECNQIEIGGNTTITHKSTSNSTFWFRNANPTFTILKDANVKITSEKRELFYGVNNLKFTISKNASLYLTTYNGLAYGTNGTETTVIDENALLSIIKTNYSGSYATWYSYGTITLNTNSSLLITNDYPNITDNNYNISFQGSNSGLYLNNPDKIILYNSKANIFNTSTTIPFSFSYSRINLFDKVIPYSGDISKDNLPTYSWYKSNGLSTISGTFNSTKTTISTNDYTEEELKTLPDLTNFNFPNKKILSIGTVPLRLNAITDKDTNMSGITDPNASILIEYNNVSTIVKANEDGVFSYDYQDTLDIGTAISFIVKNYDTVLYYNKTVEIVYSGELTLDTATKYFEFKLSPISDNPLLYPRLNDLIITVTDSRVNSSPWRLYATINHDLESSDGTTLKDSLVYINNLGEMTILSSTPTLVYTGESNDGSIKITNISWKENEGILFQLKDYLENNKEYKAEITWILEE